MSTRRSRRNSPAIAAADDDNGRKNDALAARTRSTSRPARTPSRNSNHDNATQRLRELPKIPPRPTTPIRRASSADPVPGQRSVRRTPAAPNSLRKTTGNTPHGRAAMREIELRRAAVLTPGRDRRRSLGRQQKETPMAAMRALSKLLAPQTKRPTPSPPEVQLPAPKSSKRRRIADDFDDFDEEVPARPRLSMALDNYDEDDSLILPLPKSTGLEDDNYTARSIEVPRRAASEQVGSRFSRGSFGSIRSDDRMEAFGTFDFNALGEEGIDSSFIPQNDYGDDLDENRRYSGIPREDTGTVQFDALDDAARRMSDFRRAALHNDDSNTSFMIAVPPRDDIPENMLNFGAEEMEDLPFDAVEDTIIGQANADDDMFVAMDDEPRLGGDAEEEEMEAEQDLDNEELEVELDEENENRTQNANDTLMTEDNQDDTTIQVATTLKRKKKPIKISKHGIPIPSLPAGVVKKLATTYARTSGNSKSKLNKDALAAIMQASDWFFEQAAGDLAAYSEHAKRRTIDESDVVTLMKRCAIFSPFVYTT